MCLTAEINHARQAYLCGKKMVRSTAQRARLEREEESERQVKKQKKYFLQASPPFSIGDEHKESLTIPQQSKAVPHLQAYEPERYLLSTVS